MRINNNLMAMNAKRFLNVNNANSQKSIEKLSSGNRINKAGDDAAGLAISEKMRAQIRGLNMAAKNSQDAISLIQTAEGALNETHSILQRMREVAVQAAADSNDSIDRSALANEITELNKELDRIADETEFNEKKLLNGNVAGPRFASTEGSLTNVTLSSDGLGKFEKGTSVEIAAAAKFETDAPNTIQEVTYTLSAKDKDGNAITGADDVTVKFTYDKAKNEWSSDATNDIVDFNGAKFTIKLADPEELAKATKDADVVDVGATAKFVAKDDSLSFQIGANLNQKMDLDINDMSSTGLGVNNICLTDSASANTSIKALDSAIAKVSSERAKLGANQNRLEHTINNLNTSSENLTAAESRIRDTDMADEMMNYTKNNILSQAATAMLAQANQAPQAVLQLLQ